MLSKEKSVIVFLAVLAPLTALSVVWALQGLNPADVDAGMLTLGALTLFCSCFLRIQLPRLKIHLTISDGLIILSMLLYGPHITLFLAMVDTVAASLAMRRNAVPVKTRTLVINV